MMRKPPGLEDLRASQTRFNLFGDLHEVAMETELQRRCPTGPLHGRPVGLKANIAVAGFFCTAGLEHRTNVLSSTDAPVTQRLRESGALIIPGLNMDPAALGGTTDNPHFGRTANPHAPEYSAGGSSGGSAAAVAAGVVDLALGTDTLGSVRIPASYCGVIGLKPTFGLVGRSGIVPLAPSFDTVGPIAANAADLWPLLTAIAGHDAGDPASRPPPDGWATASASVSAKDVRIAIPRQIRTVDCEAEVLAALARARTALADAGATIMDIDMPAWRPGHLRQSAFLLTEAEGAVTYSKELQASGVLPASVEALLSYGARMGTAKLVTALHDFTALRAELDRAFASVDVLLMPTTPQRAFHATQNAPVNQADFTALANVGGVPAIAVPVRNPGSPLPASVQLVGPAWSESVLIGLASLLQEAL